MSKKKKDGGLLLASFGSGNDSAAAANTGFGSEADIADRVDIKVYLPHTMRDELDRISVQKYGRGKMRTMVIEEALRQYIERYAEESPKEVL